MDSNSIMERNFTEAMRGYKKEEVEEFLSDIAREMSQLRKENDDLEKKLQVCADKIREYREDEEALKDAILGAQKTGNAIIAESKEKAANIIQEAENKRDEMMTDADQYVAGRKAEGEKIIEDALAEKQRIEGEAQKAADDIHAKMEIQTELDKEALARTKRECEDFRTRIIMEYNNHIEFIKKIPEQCFNEFVVETTNDYTSNTLRELIAAQQGDQSPIIPETEPYKIEAVAADPEETDEDIRIVESYEETDAPAEETSENAEEESSELTAEDFSAGGDFTVDNAFGTDTESDDDDDDTPDFLKSKPNRVNGGNSKFDKLEFGSNNGNNNNNRHKKKRR
ncbi:MAG: DivIVA domain-containing protein [Ruminiclostridium sp.]|nr:DivIVA domain-containing protein [Ruminiclostridium sp.]